MKVKVDVGKVFGRYAVDYEERIDFDRLRRERLERARKAMEEDGLGAIVAWDDANIRYLTSYYVTTPLRPLEAQFVVFPRNGEPHLVGGGTPEEVERRMPWLKGRVHAPAALPKPAAVGPDDPVVLKVVDQIGRILAEYGVQNEPIGIDGTTLSFLYAEAFKKRGLKPVHGKPTMDKARSIKTQDEIALMRIICQIAEKAFAAIAEAIRPGIRECDLVAIAMKVLYEEGVDHTEDCVVCSGYNTNPYNWSFSDKPIRPGELVYVDIDGASYLGYKCCLYRTFCCGKASQEQKDLYAECRDMLYAALEVIRDGVTDHEVVSRWPGSPEYWGYKTWQEVCPYALGHGIGLSLHERPFFNRQQMEAGVPPQVLREGMVIAIETYAGKKGGRDGVRLEEDIVVTKDGYERLCLWPIDELMECWLPYR